MLQQTLLQLKKVVLLRALSSVKQTNSSCLLLLGQDARQIPRPRDPATHLLLGVQGARQKKCGSARNELSEAPASGETNLNVTCFLITLQIQ